MLPRGSSNSPRPDAQVPPSTAPVAARGSIQRILRGSGLGLIAQVFARGSSFLSLLIIARMISVEDFGSITAVQSVILLLASFASAGMGSSATRFTAAARHRGPDRLALIVATHQRLALSAGLVIAGLAVVCSPLLSWVTLASPAYWMLVVAMAPSILFINLSGIYAGMLVGQERYRDQITANIATGLATLALVYPACAWLGPMGAALTLMVSQSVGCAMLWRGLTRGSATSHTTVRRNPRADRVILRYAVPSFIATLANGPFNWAAMAVLAHAAGLLAVGQYNAGHQIFIALLYLPTVIMAAAQPVAMGHYGSGNHSGLIRTTIGAVALSASLAILVGGGICLWRKEALGAFGSGYVAAADILYPLMGTVVIAALRSGSDILLRLGPMIWYEVLLSVVGGSSLLALTWIWRDHGASSLAYARFTSICIEFIVSLGILYLMWRAYRSNGDNRIHNASATAAIGAGKG